MCDIRTINLVNKYVEYFQGNSFYIPFDLGREVSISDLVVGDRVLTASVLDSVVDYDVLTIGEIKPNSMLVVSVKNSLSLLSFSKKSMLLTASNDWRYGKSEWRLVLPSFSNFKGLEDKIYLRDLKVEIIRKFSILSRIKLLDFKGFTLDSIGVVNDQLNSFMDLCKSNNLLGG